MFNLLRFINLRENKYKYYYNTKLRDINLLNPINIYLYITNTINPIMLKLYNNLIRYSYSKPKKYINILYVKISKALIGGLISALLYTEVKLHTCVIYLNKRREYLKLKSSDPSNCNGLEVGKK